ncbi:MAG: proton-conducting transporter membrane subunit [Streptosporangiaceae bacterium]|jgi:hydrogenase-4 component F
MHAVVLLLLILPVAAALACLRVPLPAARALTAVTALACFGLVLSLVPAAARGDISALRFVRIDALSSVFLLATGFLYAAVALYSIGYLGQGRHEAGFDRYSRRLWAGLNLFAWAMLTAPMMSSLALLWVAIEVTTVISALLVAIENTDGAAEAAWKYVLIASAGLGLALLATIFAYYAGAQALGQSYDLAFGPLLQVAGRLPHAPVQLAFVLAVLGFGTKMGLFPVHTWLPDAHSEAPTPVSALLSGSLLAVSFYAILRFYQVTAAAVGPRLPRDVLLVFGIASLLLASLYLFGQRDVKRLLAYSSVEHMGILAIGMSFGAPIAVAGVLLHVLAHAAAKGNAFMGAGVLVRKFGTKRISSIRGGLDLLPWSGPLFLLAILALGAMPPFGIFRSEFEIVAGGFRAGGNAAAAVLIIGVTVAFFGLAATTGRMLLQPRAGAPERAAEPVPVPAGASGPPMAGPGGVPGDRPAGPGSARPAADASIPAVLPASRPTAPGPGRRRGEPSAWMVVPVAAGAVALIVLGVHPPAELTHLLARAVSELTGAAR